MTMGLARAMYKTSTREKELGATSFISLELSHHRDTGDSAPSPRGECHRTRKRIYINQDPMRWRHR